jgi:hypothetical protein
MPATGAKYAAKEGAFCCLQETKPTAIMKRRNNFFITRLFYKPKVMRILIFFTEKNE